MNSKKIEQYVTLARKTINHNAPMIVNNNTFYYRNRLADVATRRYITHEYQTTRKVTYVYEWDPDAIVEIQEMEGTASANEWARLKRIFRKHITIHTTSRYGV